MSSFHIKPSPEVRQSTTQRSGKVAADNAVGTEREDQMTALHFDKVFCMSWLLEYEVIEDLIQCPYWYGVHCIELSCC
jgi:hypothetical protein